MTKKDTLIDVMKAIWMPVIEKQMADMPTYKFINSECNCPAWAREVNRHESNCPKSGVTK